MQDNVDFDSILSRQVADGKEFQNLFPESSCKKVPSGTGDTSYSMKQMEQMVKEYSWQVAKVAELLKTSSSNSTIDNVKDFIYSHFQYKADQEDQLLRSPACSWYDRYNGIDCKSYSILASCLLTELDIIHYIRRIKQPAYAPTEWTHVYVVVPLDQKTGNLKGKYYTVDGTLDYNTEPTFVEKDDLFMSLPHYKLNAPHNNGLNLGIGKFSLDNVKFIQDLIGSISCIGGSTYTKTKAKDILSKIEIYFNNLTNRINTSVTNKDDEAFALAINEFYAALELGQIASKKELAHGWNYCSTNSLKAIVKVWEFYGIAVKKALDAWLEDNFIKDAKSNPTDIIFNSRTFQLANNIGALAPDVTIKKPLYYYDPKPKIIYNFELTKYLADVLNGVSFDPLQFLAGLSTVAASFQPQGGGTNTNNGSGGTNSGQGDLGNSNSQTAGGGVLGFVVLGAALLFAINGFNKTPTKRTNSVKRRVTRKK